MHQKHMNKLLHFGLNIAYYRKMKNLTQEELAGRVGISRTHMGNIEVPNMDKRAFSGNAFRHFRRFECSARQAA